MLLNGYFDFLVENIGQIKQKYAPIIEQSLTDNSMEIYSQKHCKIKERCENEDEFICCEYIDSIEDEHKVIVKEQVILFEEAIGNYLKKEIRQTSNKQIRLDQKYKIVFN